MNTSPARILIVDADGRVRRGLRALLETQADLMVIGEADSSDLALACVRTLHPSLVVLDLMLPTVQAGLATARHLVQSKQACVVTSWQGGLRDVVLETGVHGFVEKGASPESVLAAIHAALQIPADRESPHSRPAAISR